MQLKSLGTQHQTGLTPSLLKLFDPRGPIEHKDAIVKKRKMGPLTGASRSVTAQLFSGSEKTLENPVDAPRSCVWPPQAVSKIEKPREAQYKREL